jgi:hypothetical protein
MVVPGQGIAGLPGPAGDGVVAYLAAGDRKMGDGLGSAGNLTCPSPPRVPVPRSGHAVPCAGRPAHGRAGYRTAPPGGVSCGGIAGDAPGDGVCLAGCPCPGPPGNGAAGFPFPGRCISLGEGSERLKAAPGTFHHAPVKARPHGVADCPAAGEQRGPGGQAGELCSRRLRGHGGPSHMPGG